MIYFKALTAFKNSGLEARIDYKKAMFYLLRDYAWVKTLHSKFYENGLGEVLEKHGYLYLLPSRLYVFMEKNSRKKLKDTQDISLTKDVLAHYKGLARFLNQEQLIQLISGVDIMSFELAPDVKVSAQLRFIHQNRREGLTSLVLIVNGHDLYYLNFLIKEDAIYIGGIQGVKNSLDEGRRFNQLSQGIPPQRFIVFIIQSLAHQCGLKNVFGIKHEAHVFQGEEKTQYKLDNFNYDALWGTLEALEEPGAWMRLPVPYLRKDLSTVNAKKRGKLRKRYAVLDLAEDALKDGMNG